MARYIRGFSTKYLTIRKFVDFRMVFLHPRPLLKRKRDFRIEKTPLKKKKKQFWQVLSPLRVYRIPLKWPVVGLKQDCYAALYVLSYYQMHSRT